MKTAGRVTVLCLSLAVAVLFVGCKPGGPVASFTMDRTGGAIPLTVQFTDTSHIGKAAGITSWAWEFGDGGVSTEQHPSHTYTTAGSYIPNLTVTTDDGQFNTVAASAPVTAMGPGQVSVPNIVGMTQPAAEAALAGAGLTAGVPTNRASATAPSGEVLSQHPAAGTPVNAGAEVAFVVSLGNIPVVVPGVTGMSEAAARTAITDAGLLEGNIVHAYSTTVPGDQVIDQVPGSGSWVNPGAPVNCVVSLGTANAELTISLPGNVPLVLVRVPAGAFQMGAPDLERGRTQIEGPVHTVTIGSDFYMGKYEITQAQWLALMGAWPHDAPTENLGLGDNHPAYYISWEDAWNFINALNTHIMNTGQGSATMRLPSEAQWEYACRAGSTTRFFFGDSLDCADDAADCAAGGMVGSRSHYLWYEGNSTPPSMSPVGAKYANWFGLFDMSGNAGELCEDDFLGGYSGAPTDGQAWTDSPRQAWRMLRGGSRDNTVEFCRSAFRATVMSDAYFYNYGFRVICNAN